MKNNLLFRGSSRALTLATIAFGANFSVWVLYAVLALELQHRLSLTALDLGLLFAAPMLTGALLRIPAGFLADRFNPKYLYGAQMLIVVPSLLALPYMSSLVDHMLLGLWIGISGTSFTFGISYVTDWFERNQQGTAMGIFGAGNAGAAITLAAAPYIVDKWGWENIGPIYAVGLLMVALVFLWLAPSRPRQAENARFEKISISLKEIVGTLQIWRFSLYYYFVFGSFLALILWLPQYYVNAYNLSIKQAMAFTLFFAATSSMVRALGGWFADRYGGRAVNWTVFWICLVCLFFLSYPPTSMTIHGVDSDVHITIEINVWVFTALIFVIGIAQGFGRASVYKTLNDYYPRQMGAVGGFVAAMGALGGCTLPIAFGLVVDAVGIYSACFMLLYGVLAICMITMFIANKTDRFKRRVQWAQNHNFLDD
ncbi:MFS transporter [Teredinibacter franksiae]|jgi:Nitrate/nitrite transporter|uniref:MFS transporter n=1 Tax=Teredinibacter franksiae TaxID=2761453 RepID=UPI0016251435|nr:MFS transporter [Teredinibacter franksiae]